ncbi:beta strand repeat-containing protein, partial [Flavobacterium psychrotolerans]
GSTGWANVANGTPTNSTYSNATSASSFSVTGNIAAGSYYYRCIASATGSGCSSSTSSNGVLTVVAVPSISAQPSNASISVGGTYSPTITASGGTPSLTYQWQYSANGSAGWANVANGTPTNSTYSNATSASSFSVTGNIAAGSYYYRCIASATGSGCSSATSSNGVLTITSNTITTGTVSGSPFCAGTSGISVPFTYSLAASFPSGGSCTFKAQLSDAAGSFASSTDLQTVVSDASGSQSISTTIPSGTGGGSGYRIRVVSNSPAVSGVDNGTNLTITPISSVASVTGTSPLCIAGTATYTANTVVLGGGTGVFSSSNTGIATVNSSTGVVTGVAAGTCNIIYTITGGCGGTVSAQQSVTISPNASVASVTGTTPICIAGTATYTANTVVLSGGTGAFSSSNIGIATVNSSTGVVTGVAAGTCNIIYTITGGCGGTISAQQSVTIVAVGTWLGGTSVDWNTASNWSCATIPVSSTNVTIPSGTTFSPNISTASAVANSVTINASATLTMSGGNTLTITSGGSFTNNNAFTPGNGTVAFAGAGTITGTTTFNNVNLAGAVSFGVAVTIDGTLSVNSGGSVTTNAPKYTTNSTLKYNTGTNPHLRGLEWSATGVGTIGTTVGYPNNVQISNNTVLDLGNGGTGTARAAAGNLTIDAGSTLTMNSSVMTAALTVAGNVNLNGTLTLSGSSGGDINVAGNWAVAASGATFNSNSRAIFFNGTGTQVITKLGGGTVDFGIAFLRLNHTGSVQLSSSPTTSVTISQTGSSALKMMNSGTLDLNGQTFTMSGTGGGIVAESGARSIIGASGSTFAVTANTGITSVTSGTLSFGSNVTLTSSAQIDFGASSITTINGTLQLNAGYTVANTPIYGASSKIIYNSGGVPAIGTEWTAASGTIGTTAGYPNNVDIQNGTTLTLNAIGADRGLAGNLTLGTGTTSNGSLTMGATAQKLTVNGNLSIGGNTSGTSTLTLSSNATSASIEVKGNWTRSSVGVFTPAGRGVFFNAATGDQTITASGGETFDYVIINKATSGNVVLANAVTINQTLTLTKGLLVLGNNNATFGASGTTSSPSTTSYMAVTGTGKVIKAHTGSFDYPVGPNLTNYAPVTINNTGASQTYTIGVANTTYSPAIDGANWQWTIAASGTSSSNLSFKWFTADSGANLAAAASSGIAQNYNGVNWTNYISSTAAASPNVTTVNGITSFANTIWTVTVPCSGTTASVLSGTASICSGASTNLQVAITGGTSPYSVVYTDGTSNFTVNGYTTGTNISVSPASTKTYSLVSVTSTGGCVGTGNSGAPTVTVNTASTAAVLSGTASICSGTSTNLQVAITGGTSPFTVVYNDGTGNSTVNGYTTGSNISVSPASTKTYTLVSVTSTGGCVGAGNSGSPVVTVTASPTTATNGSTQSTCITTGGAATLSGNT